MSRNGAFLNDNQLYPVEEISPLVTTVRDPATDLAQRLLNTVVTSIGECREALETQRRASVSILNVILECVSCHNVVTVTLKEMGACK